MELGAKVCRGASPLLEARGLQGKVQAQHAYRPTGGRGWLANGRMCGHLTLVLAALPLMQGKTLPAL